MKKKGSHITYEVRLLIEKMSIQGCTARKIAAILGISKSAIYMELKRGYRVDSGHYTAAVAQKDYDLKASHKGPRLKVENGELIQYIEKRVIDDGYSIDNVIKEINCSPKFKTKISKQTIYSSVERGVFPHLTRSHLPRSQSQSEKEMLKSLVLSKMKTTGIKDFDAIVEQSSQKRMTGDVLKNKIEHIDLLTYRDLKLLFRVLDFTDEEVLGLFR